VFSPPSQAAPDQFLHDLVGAAIDALHAGVRPHLGNGVFLHEAVAAVQLHAVVEHLALAALLLPLPLYAQTLERIKETGEIRLGYRTDAAPLSFENDAGQPQGYSPIVCYAVVEHLAEQLQMEKIDIEFIRVTTENRFEKVVNEEIDLLCGAASITLERRKTVDFSIPTYVDGATVMLQNDAPNSLEELAGRKIGE